MFSGRIGYDGPMLSPMLGFALNPLLSLALSLSPLACTPQAPDLPEKPKGLWELRQIKTEGGQIEGRTLVEQRYPGCTWGRMTWKFEDAHVSVGYDLLCPAAENDYYGCEVSVRVPAAWDPDRGQWHVDAPVSARSRTTGLSDEALPVPTSCEVSLPAGDYPVVRMSKKQEWQWEMQTPEGMVYCLQLPESDRPDFVAAMGRSTGGDR